MSIFYKLTKIVEKTIEVINTPDSYLKGDEFEKFAKTLFPPADYKLITQTNDYNQNKSGYSEDTLNPDFKYQLKDGTDFYLECKFRSALYDGKIQVVKDVHQLNRYKQIDQVTRVYVLLGLGNKPASPDYVALIPLSEIKYPALFESVVEKYLLDLDKYPTVKPALLKRFSN